MVEQQQSRLFCIYIFQVPIFPIDLVHRGTERILYKHMWIMNALVGETT